MKLVTTVSGHELLFGLKADPDGRVPRATLSIVTSPGGTKQTALLSGADVEAMIVVLRSIREKQRDFEIDDFNPCRSCKRDGCKWCFPVADESKAPAPSRTRSTGKRK